MKKVLQKVIFVVGAAVLSVTPLYAAENVDLYIDQYKVQTQAPLYSTSTGEKESIYYMDVLPQVKANRTYVPISIISKFLGAEVKWEDPTVTIIYKGSKLVLNIGENIATKDGEAIKLDAPPYAEKGRTMVPLRFISEAFGIGVDYKGGIVNIDFPKLKGKETTLYSIQREYWMTMGSKVLESKSDLMMNRYYEALMQAEKKEIPVSSQYGNRYLMDYETYDYLMEAIYFTDKAGKVVERYDLYTNNSFGMNTGIYKLRDVQTDKWYELSGEQVNKLYELETISEWQVISDTIV